MEGDDRRERDKTFKFAGIKVFTRLFNDCRCCHNSGLCLSRWKSDSVPILLFEALENVLVVLADHGSCFSDLKRTDRDALGTKTGYGKDKTTYILLIRSPRGSRHIFTGSTIGS